MLEHHRRALDLAVARLAEDPEVRLALLGGSIAKGAERPDSDVDLLVVVTDEAYARRLASGDVAFLWTDVADWDGGYVEGRYVSQGFVLEAAARGSEPTRWSFLGVRPVWGSDPEVEAALPLVPVYPEGDRARRIDAFLSQVAVCAFFFWSEGVRRNDPYLRHWAAGRVVLFAARVVLAHDRVLFPNQKRLMETLARCPSKPEGFEDLAARCLAGDEAARDALWEAAYKLAGRPAMASAARFQRDVEMAWFAGVHDVAEW